MTLITLHNTKGLEFDRVVVTGLEEGIFPHESGRHDPDEVEEERRLFYVGVTRARRRLHLTWCARRQLFGRWQEREPSRFLAEIPPSLLSVEEAAEMSGEESESPGRKPPKGGRSGRGSSTRSTARVPSPAGRPRAGTWWCRCASARAVPRGFSRSTRAWNG